MHCDSVLLLSCVCYKFSLWTGILNKKKSVHVRHTVSSHLSLSYSLLFLQDALKFQRTKLHGRSIKIEVTCGGGGGGKRRRDKLAKRNTKLREERRKGREEAK